MKDKSIIFAIVFFLIVLAYFIFYLTIHIKAEEQDFKTFEVVNGIIGIVLTAIASIFVYNTYKAQREQIELQKKEIEDNSKETEFNRVLNIIYQHSKKTIKDIKEIKESKLQFKTSTYANGENIKFNKEDALYHLKSRYESIFTAYDLSVSGYVENEYYLFLKYFKSTINKANTELNDFLIKTNLYNSLITDNKNLDDKQRDVLKKIVDDLFFDELYSYFFSLSRKIRDLHKESILEYEFVNKLHPDDIEIHYTIKKYITDINRLYENFKHKFRRLEFILITDSE